jgi:signal transduction histidine kinase
VLSNLLSNAVKYSPEGGDVLVRLTTDGDAEHEQAVLTVHDPGIGIPPEDLAHVFQRFRRANNVAGVFEGTGIGLADVDQIVRLHGGHVTVEGQPGEGTTFTVRLPRSVSDND